MRSAEIISEVTEVCEGRYHARALGYSIFTQRKTGTIYGP